MKKRKIINSKTILRPQRTFNDKCHIRACGTSFSSRPYERDCSQGFRRITSLTRCHLCFGEFRLGWQPRLGSYSLRKNPPFIHSMSRLPDLGGISRDGGAYFELGVLTGEHQRCQHIVRVYGNPPLENFEILKLGNATLVI